MTAENSFERKAYHVQGFGLAALSFSTLGVVYADIGTSPLYVLNGIWPATGPAPSEDDVIGGVSAIVWAMTLLPLLKYVGFALQFGTTAGEGGPFALYMSLFPVEHRPDDRSLTRYTTDGVDETPQNRKIQWLKWPLFCWALFGTSLTLADGILTPPVSISTAVSGIAVAMPSVENSLVGIACAFLIFIFAIQRFGATKIGYSFAPVTFIWLLLIGCTGIYNITSYPGIWRAYDPSRAVAWFMRTKDYDALNGVLLAVTGCEAMFANLAHFNRSSIRLAFACFVYPMLILQYLGQGARLINDGAVLSNIFYNCIPGPVGGGLYWVVFVFAVLAALVASQAMITGTFSLVRQLIGMYAFPAIRIKHVSSKTSGQVYIESINWLLLVGCISVTAGFGSSSAINYAYGFAVATVMFVTTTLVAVSIPLVKNMPALLGAAFLLFFGFLDGIFFGAALKKVPHGAWVPLTLGCVLALLMAFWTWGRRLEDRYDDANHHRLSSIITRRAEQNCAEEDAIPASWAHEEGNPLDILDAEVLHGHATGKNDDHQTVEDDGRLYTRKDDVLLEITSIPVLAVFHRNDRAGRGVPHSFVEFLGSYPALPLVVVFLSTRVTGIAHVALEDRYVVNKVRSLPGFFSVTMRLGYLDMPAPSVADLVERMVAIEARSAATADGAATQIATIHVAARSVTHVIPAYALSSRPSQGRVWSVVRRVLVEEVYGPLRGLFPDHGRVVAAAGRESVLYVAVPAVI